MKRLRCAPLMVALCLMMGWFRYDHAHALSVRPPSPQYDRDEIVWMGLSGNRLTAVWGDALITVWDTGEGGLRKAVYGPYPFTHPHPTAAFYLTDGEPFRLAWVTHYETYILDLDEPQRLFSGRVPYARTSGHRFSSDGLVFYCVAGDRVHVLNSKTGEEIATPRIYTGESALPVRYNAVVAPDGCYLTLFNDWMQYRDMRGDLLWEGKPMGYFDHLCQNQPLRDLIVLYSSEAPGIYAVKKSDGSFAWSKRSSRLRDCHGVSDDELIQILETDAGYCLAHFPDQRELPIAGLEGSMDFVFSDDSRRLYCLPGVKERGIHRSDCSTTVLLARDSHVVSVVDTGSGLIIERFTLPRPESRDLPSQSFQYIFRKEDQLGFRGISEDNE